MRTFFGALLHKLKIKKYNTKYTIKLSASAKIEETNKITSFDITKSVSADYNVEDQFVKTRNKERKIIKSLTNNLSDQLINAIKSQLNAN